MKIKDRRGAKGPAASGSGSLPDYLFAQGMRHHQSGQLAAAAEQYRQALAIEPGHANSQYCLGLIALQAGRNADAIVCLEQAVVRNRKEPDWHYNLGVAYQNEGRAADALAQFQRTLTLDPAHMPAKINVANGHAAKGDLDQAAKLYQSIAAAKPDQLDVRENLARIALARGRPTEAVGMLQQAFGIGATPGMKRLFVESARQLRYQGSDPQFQQLLLEALREVWGRPADLAEVCASVIKANPDIAPQIERAARAWPVRLSGAGLFGPNGLAALDREPMLLGLLHATFNTDIALERFFTAARAALLERALAPDAGPADGDTFFAALAQQCFINEYVFAVTVEELERAVRLRDQLEAALQSGQPVSAPCVVAVAAYAPLQQLAGATLLLRQSEMGSISALLTQQISEPQQEAALRASIPRATSIDVSSGIVQAQYEDNPYPRWIKPLPIAARASYDELIRVYCSRAPYRPLGKGGAVDVLIAGCGTGQTAIETAEQFPAARILAIDLSLASLAYAKRKARQARVDRIEFAQGDVLRVQEFGRAFDVIEAQGVLHHLDDPFAGWRTLLSVLRPHGVMEVGLYSDRARGDVVAARAVAAERGYGSNPDGIRRLREDIMALDDRAPLKSLARGDFFALSGCRDLLFHVRERRYSLPAIQEFLGLERLTLLGFKLPEAVLQRYVKRFPKDKSLLDLESWHAFEIENPYIFRGMYQFWVQRNA